MTSRIIKFRGKDKKPRTRRMNAYKGLIMIGHYLYVYMPSHPKAMHGKRYISIHRLIAEWKIGRKLTELEVVHHIDNDKLNNHPDNLEVLSPKIHDKLSAECKARDKYGKFKKVN